MKNKLEKAFQEALENYEVAYNPEAWQAVKKQLPAKGTPWYFYGGAAALGIIAILGVSLLLMNTSEKNQAETVQKQNELPLENKQNQVSNQHSVQLEVEKQDQKDLVPTIQEISSTYSAPGNAQKTELNSGSVDKFDPNPNEATAAKNPESSSGDKASGNPNSGSENTWNQAIAKIEITGIKEVYCENEKVQLSVKNVPEQSRVIWTLTDRIMHGNTVQLNASNHLIVSLIISDQISDNNYQRTFTFKTIQAQVPVIEVSEEIQNTKTYVTLENTNPQIRNLAWRFEGQTVSGPSVGAYLTKQGAHEYVVESYDNNGCYARTTSTVNLSQDYQLFVENSFSPNGDGLNDTFLPEALKQRSVRFTMTVFDMNQNQVFTTRDPYRPWDGTVSGSPAASGSYIWVVTLINEEGNPEQYKGTLLLIR